MTEPQPSMPAMPGNGDPYGGGKLQASI